MLQARIDPESQQDSCETASELPCTCTPGMIKNIGRQLQGERLRLLIPPGHTCKVQCQQIVVRGFVIINDVIYILDSLNIFDDHWVMGMTYDIARSIFQLPYRNVGIGRGEDSAIGRVVSSELCLKIRFMLAKDYLAIQREADLAFKSLIGDCAT